MPPFMFNNPPPHIPHHDHQYTPTNQTHQHGTQTSTRPNVIFYPSARNHFSKEEPQHSNHELNRRYLMIWNALPDSMRALSSYPLFQEELKQHLLEQQQCDAKQSDSKEQKKERDQLPASTHKPKTVKRALNF